MLQKNTGTTNDAKLLDIHVSSRNVTAQNAKDAMKAYKQFFQRSLFWSWLSRGLLSRLLA